MEEIIYLLRQMLNKFDGIEMELNSIGIELSHINNEIASLKGNGLYNSVSDVADKLDEVTDKLNDISGVGLYNSISDINDKLDSIKFEIEIK
ncbi:hypothetical protein ACFOZY_01020 [Chungangia koreensis]|uniref:Uncharacterized protein n=1 Tax=Chungangia koreensis TaxID=752657 RepID=A0ABV8X0X3_9LACT